MVDEIFLPMRDINSLTRSKMEKAWAVNNSLACKPSNMQEETQRVVHILDANYGKTDLKSVVSTNCTLIYLKDQNKLLELATLYEELLDGTLIDWKMELISLEPMEGTEPYHDRPFPLPKEHKKEQSKNEIDFVNWECWSFSPHQNGCHPLL
jgi:hypothetical protein